MAFNLFPLHIIGVDPGSETLRLVKNGSLIYEEPCLLSVDEDNDPVNFGNEALSGARLSRPVDYVINSFIGFEGLLRYAVKKADTKSLFPRRYVFYIATPMLANEVDNRAFVDSAEQAGGQNTYLVPQAIAAAVGMDLLFVKRDFILIDFGASKVEITVFANALVVAKGVCRLGTWKIARAVQHYLRKQYQINATESEVVKILQGNKELKGTEVPDINDAISPYVAVIRNDLQETLDSIVANPHVRSILGNGIFFTGGGSLFRSVAEGIIPVEGIRLTFSNTPLADVHTGLQKIKADKEKYSALMEHHRSF